MALKVSAPYYEDARITIYLGDARAILPGLRGDLVVADPPYGETSLLWDKWPDEWPMAASSAAPAMWCFGSLRMFLSRYGDFRKWWTLSQDVIWEKNVGSAFATDRFMRLHETLTHWYRGPWAEIHHSTPRYGLVGRTRASGGAQCRRPTTATVASLSTWTMALGWRVRSSTHGTATEGRYTRQRSRSESSSSFWNTAALQTGW